MSVSNLSSSNKRSHSAENGGREEPHAKRQKTLPTATRVCEHLPTLEGSFAYLPIAEVLLLSRTSKTFKAAVNTYYGRFPSFGMPVEIFNRLSPIILATQGKQYRLDELQEEIRDVCTFIATRLRQLPPHERLTVRSQNVCPRRVELFGPNAYAIFDDPADRLLSDDSTFKEISLCYSSTEEVCVSSKMALKKESAHAIALQEEAMAIATRGLANIGQTYHTYSFTEGGVRHLGMIGAFYNGGDLRNFLVNGKIQQCSLDVIVRLAYQICFALKGLHGRNIVHRDLKLENIMLDQHENELNGYIIDLGGAKPVQEGEIVHAVSSFGDPKILTTYESTTLTYFSPQLCRSILLGRSCPIRFENDLWALGKLLYTMATAGRVLPHEHVNDQLLAKKSKREFLVKIAQLTHVALPIPIPKTHYAALYPLIEALLKVKSEERLSLDQALSWLQELYNS